MTTPLTADRITTHSIHEAENPARCPGGIHLGTWRTLTCDGVTDVVECPRCGRQKSVPCNFDEEYS